MLTNPYTSPSILNTLLTQEHCQLIHFHALQKAVAGDMSLNEVPEPLWVIQLRQELDYFGYENCFSHPSHITDIFQGVSTDILSLTETLYCHPIRRSIATVHRILGKMAEESHVNPVSYEAVWAICAYFERLHEKRAVIKHQVTEDSFHIYLLSSSVKTCDDHGEVFIPHFIVVVSEQKSQIMGFSLSNHHHKQEQSLLALYEALSSLRQPASLETGGIIWHKPANIKSPANLLPTLQKPCQLAGIHVQEALSHVPGKLQTLLDNIRADWNHTLSDEIVPESKLRLLFDTYLYKAHGYSPGRTMKNQAHQWSHLDGYNRDPASSLPQLRHFLPSHMATVKNGAVACNGFHYEHPLLDYWPDTPATLRISYEDDSRCWVYIEGEVLCEARAREMRRLDGTYRNNRNR